MKTSELQGAALDWAVARCEGGVGENQLLGAWYAPSTDWAQGGPIIEREGISVQCIPAGTSQGWWAIKDSTFHDRSRPDETRGDTPLIAAMRCFVSSRLGDEVDVPDELASNS